MNERQRMDLASAPPSSQHCLFRAVIVTITTSLLVNRGQGKILSTESLKAFQEHLTNFCLVSLAI